MTELLFTYGTLMPANPDEADRDGFVADAVRGRLFDLGDYPALIDLDTANAGWVEGFVRPVDRSKLDGPIDAWEEVEAGLYRRAETTTRQNHRVWVYVYARPLPAGAAGPFSRWDGRRRANPHKSFNRGAH